MAGKFRVFVYGTLKRGFSRHAVLSDQSFVGSATSVPDYLMYDLGDYPGLVEVAMGTGSPITGEVFDVDLGVLKQLDEIEAVDSGLYARHGIRLVGSTMGPTDAYFYLQSVANRPLCGSNW